MGMFSLLPDHPTELSPLQYLSLAHDALTLIRFLFFQRYA
jgi:hypothetical protein